MTWRHRNAFTSLERNEHGLRRRRTAALYSKSALLQSQHLHHVTDRILYERLLPKLNEASQGSAEIDGLELSYSICSDCLSSFLFGYSNGTEFLSQSQSTIAAWRLNYEKSMCHESFFVQEMPYFYNLLKNSAFNLLPRSYSKSKKALEDWLSDMASKADRTIDEKYRSGLPLAPADEPVIYETAKTAVEKDSPHLDNDAKRNEVLSEMFDHVCKFDSL